MTIEVEIDSAGHIFPVEPTDRIPQGRALLTWQTPADQEAYLLSEASLAQDWLRPEEDEAWSHLQPGK